MTTPTTPSIFAFHHRVAVRPCFLVSSRTPEIGKEDVQ